MSEQAQAPQGVAIVSMNGRFPGANDVERFWGNLRNGVESITRFTADELIEEGHDPELVNLPEYVKAKGIVDGVDLFDAFFFGFSPREAETMDPQHRIFLECCWEALELAGYDSNRYPGRIGVFAGTGPNTYLLNNLLPHVEGGAAMSDVFALSIGNDKDFVPTRVSYELNLTGPSIGVNTGCSSALVATTLAVHSLLTYQCDMALAGGVTLSFPHKAGYRFQAGMIGSPDGHCRSFDAQAQGAVGSDGAAVVVLKRIEDALADGDTIHCVIRGCAINNDGSAKVGFTAPSVAGQVRVISEALAMAEVDPSTIGYVEAHGSATALGDPIEVQALTIAFGKAGSSGGLHGGKYCALGSVKSNIGHTDAAAGVAGLIKTALALKHGEIPPTLHFSKPNPHIDFDSGPFYVNPELVPWPQGPTPRRAGVSSFGIGGTNAHVILEEAPRHPASGSARAFQILPVSAKTPSALTRALSKLATFLEAHPDTSLADVAFTLANRREFPYREVIVASSLVEAIDKLHAACRIDPASRVTARPDGRVALLFPGEAARPQLHGALYRAVPAFQSAVERCAAWASAAGIDFEAAPVALFAFQYALAQSLMEWGIKPVAMFGSGFGEWAAACLAGMLPLEDALALAAGRTPRGKASPRTRAVPVVSGRTGLWLSPSEAGDSIYWAGLGLQAPNLEDGLGTLAMTADIFVDVGPGAQIRDAALHHVDLAQAVVIAAADSQSPAFRDLLGALAELWRNGASVDWDAVFRGERKQRIPLPTYPFERQSYLLKPPPAHARKSAPLTNRPQPAENWVYAPTWKHAPVMALELETDVQWLVVADRSGLAERLAARLAAARQAVKLVVDSISSLPLLREFSGERLRIVHLLSVDPLPPESPLDSFTSLVDLLRAIEESRIKQEVEVVVVLSSLFNPAGSGPVDPWKALALGPILAARQEYPNIVCRVVDVDQLNPSNAGLIAARLFDEICVPLTPARRPIALRAGRRWEAGFERMEIPANAAARTGIREGGVYLVTEGLEEAGLALAQAIAPFRPRVALAGRSAIPPREEWKVWLESQPATDPICTRIRALQALEASGAVILLLRADPESALDLAEIATKVRQHFGALNGVFHCLPQQAAAVPIGEMGKQSALLHAQASAATALCDSLAGHSLDFLILCSSLDSVAGGFGRAIPAAMGAFFEALTWRTDSPATLRSIQWDRWSNISDRVPEVLSRVLASGLPQAIVSTFDLESIMENTRSHEALLQAAASNQDAPKQARPDLGIAFEAPQTGTEMWVAAIWEAHLGIAPIGRNDDFFRHLGGQSLSAIALINRVQQNLADIVPLRSVFAAPTVAQFSAYLETEHASALAVAVTQESSGLAAPAAVPRSSASLLDRIDQLSEDELDAALGELLNQKQ